MSINPSNPRRAAENALWYALEERRDQIRAAGLPFDERSHHRFRELHAERRLISAFVAGVARYKAGGGDPVRLKAIAVVMKAGLPTWEHLLIQPSEPWAPYVTQEAKRGARAVIADAQALILFV